MSQLSLHDGGFAVAFFRAILRRVLPILLLIFIGFGLDIPVLMGQGATDSEQGPMG